jgi:hypothetical protein
MYIADIEHELHAMREQHEYAAKDAEAQHDQGPDGWTAQATAIDAVAPKNEAINAAPASSACVRARSSAT